MVGHVLRKFFLRTPLLAQRGCAASSALSEVGRSSFRRGCHGGGAQGPPQDSQSQDTKVRNNVRRYALSRYIFYVRRFESTLETNFPSAMHVYRVFVVGIRDFYEDLKKFIRIARWMNKHGTEGLTRHELEVHFQMPKDMIRVAPVLVLSALPFANYVVFPLAYIFPRHLLCRHFWSLQQRADFSSIALKKRLFNQRPLLRCLQARLGDLEEGKQRDKYAHIVGLLGSGVHPNVQQIENISDLFSENQLLGMTAIWADHKNALVRLHGMHMGWRRRKRLRDRAKILRDMDFAMAEEGVTTMSHEEMKTACFLRGLNPINVKTDDLIMWLHKWSLISGQVDDDHLSLILHLPVLLGYNQSSNWVLLYGQ